MTAATQITHAAFALQEQAQSSAPPDAARDHRLYAIWKAVFERAKPVSVRTEDPRDTTADALAEPVQLHPADAGHVSMPVESAAGYIEQEPHGVVAAAAGAAAPDAATREFEMPVGSGNGDPTFTGETAGYPSASIAVRNGVVQKSASLASHDSVSMQSQSSAPVQAEAVSVFVQGTTVAIVVRDAAMSEQQALHCAFETARQLAGQRSSLRQLILNGRILYRQPSDAEMHAASASALSFAC